MIKQLKRFTRQMFIGANVASIILTLLIGYAGHLDPTSHPILSNANFLFPIFLVINFCFLVFWLLFRPRLVIIPLLGFIVCYQPTRGYFPLNINRQVPDSAIKVLSYNVWLFRGWEYPDSTNPIIQYILKQDADIVCLQESSSYEIAQAVLDSTLGKAYKYEDTSYYNGSDMLSIYSRYPILYKERIPYPSAGNHSVAFTLDVNGEEVVVINNHMETVGLTANDKKNFKDIVKGRVKGTMAKDKSMRLIDKLAEGAKKRAPQARAVASYIRKHAYQSIICVGDFNDSPLSYAHHQIDKELTDCYTATGNGPGISYHFSGFYVRIDNIFCSKDWTPYQCKVDNTIDLSDHYPIICSLKKARSQ